MYLDFGVREKKTSIKIILRFEFLNLDRSIEKMKHFFTDIEGNMASLLMILQSLQEVNAYFLFKIFYSNNKFYK